MKPEEPEVPPDQFMTKSEISIGNLSDENENTEKHYSSNENLRSINTSKDDLSNCSIEQEARPIPAQAENMANPAFEEEVLGDNVAINFEPPGRYFVETEVNFMTANMSLSMRRTVRTRTPPQQRPPIDPETALALITKPCVNLKIKAREVLKFVECEPDTADLKISLYIVACESRAALKPYPTSVVEETDAGQESLSLVNEEIPAIKLLKLVLSDISNPKTTTPVIAILHWLLILLQEPKLKRLPPETFHSIFQKVDKAVNFQQPTHIFKLMFSRSSPTETMWQAKKADRKSFFAFYTDSLDKMHSIVHIGFYPTLMKQKGSNGPGVYFYTDLKHCIEKAATSSCWGWGKSDLGVEMRVVLVAEFLEDPDTKCFNEFDERFCSSDQKALTNGPQGEEELICYLVPRPDEIRIRYVLVFVQTAAKSLPCIVPIRQKTIFNWIGDHKTSLFIGGTLALTLATRHYVHLQSIIHGLKEMMLRSVFYNVDIND